MAPAWIGNSVTVAVKHYLELMKDHFKQAAQNPAQKSSESISLVSDQLWVAFVQTEPYKLGNYHSWMSRAISTDGGYTWSPPELCFNRSVPAAGIAPGASGGLHFIYDLGRTWTQEVSIGGYANPILLDNDTLLVANGQNWNSFRFRVRRRISAGKIGAE